MMNTIQFVTAVRSRGSRVGTGERRDRERQQRRQGILSAARELFWERGFAGTTMPDVAREAELAPGTLYLYFPSKDALYAELLVEGYDLLLAELRRCVRAKAAPRQQAEALVDGFLGFARGHPEYFDIIFFVLQRERRGGPRAVLRPEQLARLEAREAACKAIAGGVIASANARRSAKDERLLVDAVWSMLVGFVSVWVKDPAFGELAATVRRLLVEALFREA
jgi:AcrR family transcriptional regulator